MGLARWIWTDDDPAALHVWVYARRRFAVCDPAGAVLEITADLRYTLWVNGVPVGVGPPKSHWETPTVDRYAVDGHLRPGRNTIAVCVYSYGGDGRLSSVMPRRGALRACLALADGPPLVTDRSWRVRRERGYAADTVRRGEHQPPAEVFDGRGALAEPWRPDFDDSDWQQATELPETVPPDQLELRDIPLFDTRVYAPDRCVATGVADFARDDLAGLADAIAWAQRRPDNGGRVRAGDRIELDATGLPDREGCYALWDFGRIWAGYPVLTLRGTSGTVVDLSYAEHLRRGTVDPTKHGLHYWDRLILGDRPLAHRITWPKCFRYLQADVHGGRAVIDSVALERSTYPVQWRGSFHCSDPVLDQAWQISAHTVQLCMEDSYMDTPWRERGSWLGDDLPKFLANAYVFGDAALMRRFLRQHARGQLPSGAMQGTYPASKSSHISTWTLSYPVSVREYIRHSGDRALAAELWPTIERILGWLESYRLPQGVYGNLPLEVTAETNIYNFIDWAPVDTRGANAAWNAHAFNALEAAAYVAGLAGEPAAGDVCRSRAAALQERFRQIFWDEGRGVFVNGWYAGARLSRWGCHENCLAVLFGLASDPQRDAILRRLKTEDLYAFFVPDPNDYDPIIPGIDSNHTVAIALNRYRWPSDRMVPVGTPYFAGFALAALCRLGLVTEALEFIRRRWGEFSRQGGTTIWETWRQDTGSLSHGWGCAPVSVLGQHVLGVTPAADASADYFVLPQRGDLDWVRGRVPTPKGLIEVAWQYDGQWALTVTLPEHCTAWVGLPVADGETLARPPDITLSHGGHAYQAVRLHGGTHCLAMVR